MVFPDVNQNIVEWKSWLAIIVVRDCEIGTTGRQQGRGLKKESIRRTCRLEADSFLHNISLGLIECSKKDGPVRHSSARDSREQVHPVQAERALAFPEGQSGQPFRAEVAVVKREVLAAPHLGCPSP